MARIAFLGLGIMGAGMAQNLAKAGHAVTAWNRTRGNIPGVLEGVTVAGSIAEAADGAEFALIAVTGPEAQRAVIAAPDGLAAHAPAGCLVIDSTSSDPALAHEFAALLAARGAEYADAPVFGSRDEAAGGTLDWLFGGTGALFARAEPVLRAMSKTVTHIGPLGTASAMKLAGNLMVAAQFVSLAEGLAIARRAGVPDSVIPTVLDAVDFGSGLLRGNARSALAGDWTPFFYAKHMLKDACLVQDLARAMGVPVSGVPAAVAALTATVNAGHGDENVSAVVAWVEASSRAKQ